MSRAQEPPASIAERALALEGPAREAYLREACGEDGELRAAVSEMLAPTQMEQTRAGTARGGATEEELAPGTDVGRFCVEGVLGRGGGGTVYRARDGATGEHVALKTTRRADPALLDGLRREIRALARLRHPGIVRIVDDGLHDGAPWYAMELLEGHSLRRLMPLPRAEALGIVRRLCAPLAHVHGEGLVHRDLKPENVVRKADGSVVLVDFGLMQLMAGDLSREALQVSGAIEGTVAYIAPEQARGEAVDARADLYALGAILFELLTGAPPFVGESAWATLCCHRNVAPPPPSSRRPDVPPALDALVLALLSKEPRHRIGHALDLAQALAELGAGGGDDPSGPPPRPYLYRPRLIGRGELLEELVGHAVRGARDAARGGGLLLLSGPSGIGKTRLASEVAAAARRDHDLDVIAGQSAPGAPALQALRPLLLHAGDRVRAGDGAALPELLARHGRLLAPHEPLLLQLPAVAASSEPPELPAREARLRLGDVLATLLAELGGRSGLMLVLDDLQWADDLLVALLGHLARVRPPGVTLLGTCRSEEGAAGLGELGAVAARQVVLPRLAPGSLAELVEDMLAVDPPPALVELVEGHAEGNPLFAAELLRAAVAEGRLARDARGGWRLAASPGELQVSWPRALADLLERRLHRLSSDAAELADVASVIGRDVEAGLLAALSGPGGAAGDAAFTELVRAHVIEEPEPGRIRFAHERLRQAAYGRLDAERRRRLHLAAGRALESLPAPQLELRRGSIAHHLEAAGLPAEAAPHAIAGARGALARHAMDEAERLFRQYLRVAMGREDAVERASAMRELAQRVLDPTGRSAEGLELVDEALALARAGGNGEGEVALLASQGWLRRSLGDLPAAARALEEAIRLADARGVASQGSVARSGLATVLHAAGDTVEAERCYSEAIAMARESGDRRLVAVTESNLAIMLLNDGRWRESMALMEHALAEARALDQRMLEGRLLANLAEVHRMRGERAPRRALLERSLEIARALGNPFSEASTLWALGNAAGDEGRNAEGRAQVAQALAIARRIGDPILEGSIRVDLAAALLADGELESAAEGLEQARVLVEGADDALLRVLHAHRRAELLLLQGDAAGAAALLHEVAPAAAVDIGEELQGRSLAARAALARGRDGAGELEAVVALVARHELLRSSDGALQRDRLVRAVDAAAAGRTLLAGLLPEDLPPALRARLEGGAQERRSSSTTST